MKMSITSNRGEFARGLGRLATKEMPFASVIALNDVAFKVREKEIAGLSEHLDRPTPFTKRAFLVRKARKNKLVAFVYTKDIQGRYLSTLARGGTETTKHAVPGEQMRLNKYGNLARTATKRKRTFLLKTRSGLVGVWQRVGRGKSSTIRMVAHFNRPRSYKKGTFPFTSLANKAARSNFKRAMRRGMEIATR